MKSKSFIVLAAVLLSISHSAFAASISGKAMFEGAAPVVDKIKADADPKCKAMHPEGLDADEVLVSAEGGLKDVFVYVKEGLSGQAFEAPKDAVIFDQKGCQYSPKVFGIQVGQPLEIRNSDNTLHNVHSLSKNTAFNLGMPIQNMKIKKSFTKPEVMVKIKCDVHPWMSAYAGVLDHPFFAVSSADGSFEIKNLPPGQYTVEAWHAKYGSQTQNITIASDAETPSVSFGFKAA